MKERMVFYSPDCIDLILFHALKDVKDGTYIDVGANDPWYESVTKIFYERGWSGINIEPQKEYHDLLEEDRPRDVNLCVGAGNSETELVLYGDLQWASMDKKLALNNTRTTVKVLPLTKILDEHIGPGKDIHFCKIDVEGFEKEVLEGLDFKRYRPWIFAVEALDPRNRKPNFEIWEHVLTDNGYVLALGDINNRYYVDSARIELKDSFVNKEELIGMYDAYRVTRISSIPTYSFFKDTLWNVLRKIRNK